MPVVDHHAHWYPFEALQAGKGSMVNGEFHYESPDGGFVFPLAPRFWDLDAQLQGMADNGIDVAVVSANMLGDVDALGAGEAQEYLETVNEMIAGAQREHPGKIAGLGMLPMAHPELALQTLDRAIGELDLRGVCILSNIAGAPIFNDDLMPVYKRIDELGVPIYLHPHNSSMLRNSGLDTTTDVGAAWLLDTTTAALTLVYRGVLDACPNITVVHPHAGGVMPFVHGRVAKCEWGTINERPLLWYLRNRFFADSAGDTPGTLGLTVQTYGGDRVVFGTDWPWYDYDYALGMLASLGDAAQSDVILSDNAVTGMRLDP